MIGLGKEIDDIRDARLESERNTRTLLDESRKENDCVSAITFRLRIESKKWNDNAARYGCDESGGKENSRCRVFLLVHTKLLIFLSARYEIPFHFRVQNSQSRISRFCIRDVRTF